jgi:hypothetical protein
MPRLKAEDVRVENAKQGMDNFQALLGRLVRVPKSPPIKASPEPPTKPQKEA